MAQVLYLKDTQDRKYMSDIENTESIEQFKMDKEMHRLIRKFGGPEVYSIYSHLLDSASKKNEWACWPSYDSIMEDLGILNRPVIADALNWLFDADLIEWGLEGRKAWFIPTRKANSSLLELLLHIPSFRNRTKRDMNGSITELSIVLIENANVYQENEEEIKTLDTSVSNGAEAPAIDNPPVEKLNIESQSKPDSRGLKRRWREAFEACQGDFRAQSGVMAKLWTEITGRKPEYNQLNGLAKEHNSQWVVCEGILKMANYDVVDNPLVFLRKVLSNGNQQQRRPDMGTYSRPKQLDQGAGNGSGNGNGSNRGWGGGKTAEQLQAEWDNHVLTT